MENCAIYVPFCGYSLRSLQFPPKVMVAEAALCYDAGFVFEEDFE